MNHVKCKVVMLSTEKANARISTKDFGKGNGLEVLDYVCENTKAKHLYVLSDEEIKQNDWYLSDGKSSEYCVHKCDSQRLVEICNSNKGYIKGKIIASTDESLNLPRPSDNFIKAYCKANGNGFDEVLVEYISIGNYDVTFFPPLWQNTGIKLKVAPDNTITIHPVIEKTYTREEVEKFMCMAWDKSIEVQIHQTKYFYSDGKGIDGFTIKDWIKKSLE